MSKIIKSILLVSSLFCASILPMQSTKTMSLPMQQTMTMLLPMQRAMTTLIMQQTKTKQLPMQRTIVTLIPMQPTIATFTKILMLKNRQQLFKRSFSTGFDSNGWHMDRVTFHDDVPHVYISNKTPHPHGGNSYGDRLHPLDVPNLHIEKDFSHEDRSGSHETLSIDGQLAADQYFVTHNQEIIDDIFEFFSTEINKQSYKSVVLEEKEKLEKDIAGLQTQKNVFYIEPHVARQLHNEIEAKQRAVEYCDTIIERYEKEIASFAHEIQHISIDVIKKEVVPSLIGKQKDIKKDITHEEHFLNSQLSNHEKIEQQLDAFGRGGSLWSSIVSTWAHVNAALNTDCSKKDLTEQKRIAENHIANAKDKLQHLYEQNRMCDAQITCAQKIAMQHQQDLNWQDLGISADACTQIHDADVKLNNFEDLSADAQKEITDYLNYNAQANKNSSDPSCKNFFIAITKIADTACQAYHTGHSELATALIDSGTTLINCAIGFSKGFVNGVGNSVKNNLNLAGNVVVHPIKTLEGLANGVVNIANFVLKHDGPLVAASLCPINSIVAFGANVASALVDTAQELSKLPLAQACERLGEMTGEFGADLVILDGALKGASLVKNIAVAETIAIIKTAEQELSAAGKLTQAERAALTNSENLVVAADNGLTLAMEAKEVEIVEELSYMDKKRIQKELGEQVYVDAQEVVAKNKADQLAADIVKEGIIEGKEPFKFVDGALDHIMEPHRKIPIATMQDVIQNPMHVIKDPRGTSASKYFSQIWKDGKLYNAELVFDKSTNEVLHFLYDQGALGPLPKVK